MYSDGVNDPSDSVRYNFQDDRTTNHVPFLKSIFKGKRYWVRGDHEHHQPSASSSSSHQHQHHSIGGRKHHHRHRYEIVGAHNSSPTISASTTATNLSSEDIMTPQQGTGTTGGSHHLGSNLRLGHGADIEPLNPSRKDLRQDSPSVEKELMMAVGTAAVRKSCTFEQVLTAISVSLVSLVIGFVSAYTAPAAESLKQDLNITEFQYSWVCGLMPLSALVGGLTGGQLIDYFGRKKTIGVTNVLYLFAWALCACAPDIWWVYGSRCIIGFGVGIASLALPVYLGETIQPEVRGTLGLLPAAFGNTGILVCFVAGSYVNWQSLAWVGFAFSVPFLGLMFFIEESPRWYVTKRRDDEAMAALRWLRGGKAANITAEFQDLINSQKECSQTTTAVTDLLTKAYVRPLLISLGLMFFQQLSGINAVIFYTTTIFKMAGNTNDMYMCTIIVGVVNFISTFIATLLIDKLGRKVLLYISSIAMVLTLAVLGTYFYLVHIAVDVSAFGWLPLASFVVYVLGFSLGFGPIPWLMMGEILPSKIRGTAASLATAFNWSCTFIVTKTFVDIIALIGPHGTFWLFGGFCLFAVVFVCACVPETQGKSLEDIERKFAGESVRRVSSIANFKPSPFGS